MLHFLKTFSFPNRYMNKQIKNLKFVGYSINLKKAR